MNPIDLRGLEMKGLQSVHEKSAHAFHPNFGTMALEPLLEG
jgi:hypothetical protein